ncbi:sulfite exporter TauE/SafE family protein [Treponema sp.]
MQQTSLKKLRFALFVLIFLGIASLASASTGGTDVGITKTATATATGSLPWWAWILLLSAATFLIGIVAVLGGVGGGVLFVPLVGSFFPFHMDYVRCAGLLIALAGSLSASPTLLRLKLADLRLSIPAALIASVGSIIGARIGLALPSSVVQIAAATLMMGIAILLLFSKRSAFPEVLQTDTLGRFLGLGGTTIHPDTGELVEWKVKNTLVGFLAFILVGLMAGMFGLGAGWANVPVLNLAMGVPLKIAVATSNLIIAVSSTTAAWVYINKGALIPLIVVPAVIGMMGGTKIGAKLLGRLKPAAIRKVVLCLLIVSALVSYLKGFGLLG